MPLVERAGPEHGARALRCLRGARDGIHRLEGGDLAGHAKHPPDQVGLVEPGGSRDRVGADEATAEEYQRIVQDWASEVMSLGIEVKGLWLVDFDNGSGYYCWKYPEASLEYFHGYEEGFDGRLPLQ